MFGPTYPPFPVSSTLVIRCMSINEPRACDFYSMFSQFPLFLPPSPGIN